MAQTNVTSLCMHWHTVFNWQADLVLLSKTRLTAVAQQVMRAQAGALGWQAFSGAPLESRGAFGTRRPGAWTSWCATPSRRGRCSPKRALQDKADSLGQALWHSTRWWHVLVGFGRGSQSLHAWAAYGVSLQPALKWAF